VGQSNSSDVKEKGEGRSELRLMDKPVTDPERHFGLCRSKIVRVGRARRLRAKKEKKKKESAQKKVGSLLTMLLLSEITARAVRGVKKHRGKEPNPEEGYGVSVENESQQKAAGTGKAVNGGGGSPRCHPAAPDYSCSYPTSRSAL